MCRGQREIFPLPRLLAASFAAFLALNAATLNANPSGPTVVHGSVGFSGLATSALTITNQTAGNAVIHWNGFSIGAHELTRFTQFANLAVLNRVTGTEVSSILGSLQSDGRVFLINPNGIVFGASARLDVAGLVASSLELSDQDFLAGRLRFAEVPGAGAVVNHGVIESAAGGRVYLVAPSVENNGLIRSPQGAIVLAAGREVELVDAASPSVTVKVAAAGQAVNVGELVAEGGSIGMFGALLGNAGVVEANGAVAGPGGEIRLVATKDLTLDAGSVVSANGTSGGSVLLQAESGTNLIGGTAEAKGSSGSGGDVRALGVRVGVVGDGAIDASGETGGGTVLVGGDYQGANPEVQNAERTYVGAGAVIRADAKVAGDGGRVIVWADGDTRFHGSISARGGSESGAGGFVETSGKESLQALGTVVTAAPHGQGGTWLLDPRSISIHDDNSGPDDKQLLKTGKIGFFDSFGAPAGNATIGVGTIDHALQLNGKVILQAYEDITLQTDVDLQSCGALKLQAGNDIKLGDYSISLRGDLTLIANDPAKGLDADRNAGSITSLAGGGNIATRGGEFTASGVSITLGEISTRGGAAGAGNASLYAREGGIAVNGDVDVRGAMAVYGGQGGNGGSVDLAATGPIEIQGAILAAGGSGGVAGDGGHVRLRSGGLVRVNAGGAPGGIAIDVSGGDGADGGDGGSIHVIATPDMHLFGSLDASGGAGGAEGRGGAGGIIYLDASTSTDSQTGDGFIYVQPGTRFSVEGGSGRSSGVSGTFERNSDYFGTIVGIDTATDPRPGDPLAGEPRLSEEIDAGFQQVVGSVDDAVAFFLGGDRAEDEDRSQTEFGSCKG